MASLTEELSSLKNHDKIIISDYCKVTDEQSIKNFLMMNQDQQNTLLQQRTLCFKKIKPDKINLVKTLIELILIQNKTMNMFLKQSLIELLDLNLQK